MSLKRKLVIFSIILGCAVALVALLGVFFYQSFLAPLFAAREPPPALREAKTLVGADLLTKSKFYEVGESSLWEDVSDPEKLKLKFDSIEDMSVGQLDGQAGLDIGLAGSFGMSILDAGGALKKRIDYQFEKGEAKIGPLKTERVKDSFHNMRVVDVEGDGVCEILGYGGLDGAALFSHEGRVLFNRGGHQEGQSSIREVAAGDIDGDGKLEFVASWGHEQWSLELFDRFGSSRWRREDEFSHGQMELVDLNRDGKAEIVEADGQELKIRDAQGKVTSSANVPLYLSYLSLCPRPDGRGALQNLAVKEGRLALIDLDGKNFSNFEAPLSKIKLEKPQKLTAPGMPVPLVFDTEEVYRAKGAWVKLRKDQPEYLAVIARFAVIDRSLFYVYDEQGKLIYHEILPEACNAIARLSPENDAESEDILVAGEKTVWRYAAR
jgi:hypothetical protein